MNSTKESRLSFRITNKLSKKIDEMVKSHKEISNRSDFGIKATFLYLSYLENEPELQNIMEEAIIALADDIEGEFPSVEKLKEKITQRDSEKGQ